MYKKRKKFFMTVAIITRSSANVYRKIMQEPTCQSRS